MLNGISQWLASYLSCPVVMPYPYHTQITCSAMPSLYALPLTYPVFIPFPSYAQSLCPTTDIPCLHDLPSYSQSLCPTNDIPCLNGLSLICQSSYPTAGIPCRDVLPLSCPVLMPYHVFAYLPCAILAQTYAYLVHALYTSFKRMSTVDSTFVSDTLWDRFLLYQLG